MKSLFASILNAGIRPGSTENHSVQIINKLALITAVMVILIGTSLFFFCYSWALLAGVYIEAICFAGVIFLNKFGKALVAGGATLVIHCFFALYFGALLGPAMPILPLALFLLTFLIGASFIVYRSDEIRIICIITTVILFLAIVFNNQYQVITRIPLSEGSAKIITILCWVGLGIMIVIVPYYFITLNDQYLAEIKRLLNALEQANNAKSVYLRTTNHELRTPLNSAFSLAQLLKAKCDQYPAETQLEVNDLYISLCQTRQIVNDVLDLSKIEAGKMDDLVMEPIVIHNYIEQCISLHRYKAKDRKISIKLDFAPTLPDCMVTDKLALMQIINNLCGNAVKFAAKGTKVAINVYPDNGFLCCDIENHGIIPADQQSVLFQAFQSSRNSSSPGTGLGLFISRHLVEKAGGSLVFKTGYDSTRFSFTLPLVSTDSRPVAEEMVVSDMLFAGYHFLVVEDEAISRRILSILKKKGGMVTYAENGEEALELINEGSFDMIISDREMPGMDGVELLRHIRANPKFQELPVIITTGTCTQEDKETILGAGANGILIKPYMLNDLYQLIRQKLAFSEV